MGCALLTATGSWSVSGSRRDGISRLTTAGGPPTDSKLTSFGGASTELQGPDLALKMETLLRTADECLYRSKQAGRNRTTAVEIPAP